MKTQTRSLLLLLCCAVLRTLNAQPATTDTLVYSCTFEEDYESNDCGGITIISYPDGFTWTWFSGSTPSLNTGPDWDHTLGPNVTTGHYMYTEATDFYPGDVAQLVLPPVATPSQDSPLCLTFWRHMYGIHIGTMNVTQTFNGGEPQVLWSLSGNQNYSWDQQNVTLQPQGGSFGTITFVGVRGGHDIGQPYGDEAIDDIYIYQGSCGLDTTQAASTSTATSTATSTTTATTTSTATSTAPPTTTSTTRSTTTAAPTTTTMAAPTTTSTVPTTTTSTTTVPATSTSTATSTQTSADPTTPSPVSTAAPSTPAAPLPGTPEALVNAPITSAAPQSTATSTGAQSTAPITSTIAPTTTTIALPDTTSSGTSAAMTSAAMTSAAMTSSSDPTTAAPTATSSAVTSHSMTSQTAGGTTMQGGATANAAAQSGGSTNAPVAMLWGLTADKMIIILAVLSALVLLLLIACVLLACCLAVTRRDYHVERAANQYASNSTLDTAERGGGRK